MSAADCALGPLAIAARERGERIEVRFDGGRYSAVGDWKRGTGATAQDACDALERRLQGWRKKMPQPIDFR